MTKPLPMTPAQVVRTLLERSPSVFLHIDRRHAGLEAPPSLLRKASPVVVFQIGYDMPVPILDLTIADDGVRATLSFNRVAFPCFVPWGALKAACGDDGRGAIFDRPWFDANAEAGLTSWKPHPSERPYLRRVK